MKSIKDILIKGVGPSSSHTMGPMNAIKYIISKYPSINNVEVTLFGSLSDTGKGHLTDYIIDLYLKDIPHRIIFDSVTPTNHPNTLLVTGYLKNGTIFQEDIISIGGGTIITSDSIKDTSKDVYTLSNFTDILNYCSSNNLSLIDFVLKFEEADILEYLSSIYDLIVSSIYRGIDKEGLLPGELKVQRKAKMMLNSSKNIVDSRYFAAIAAFAVSEENASGGEIVLAPTCGSSGVLPGAIMYLLKSGYKKEDILKGLLVSGLVGIISKTNASISGAECGCQAEIGVACSMSAALIATVRGYSNENIAQAIEIALEHSLGLTCDPVKGYVQIPCIERCAMFALKAIDACDLALIIPHNASKVSFDNSLKTMYETGKDLQKGYRETAQKGLAKNVTC